jgi:hypothetical protein
MGSKTVYQTKRSTFAAVSSPHKHMCYCITRPVSHSLLRMCNTKNIRSFTSVSPYVGVFPQTSRNFTFELKSTSPKLQFYFLIIYYILPLYSTALRNCMQPSTFFNINHMDNLMVECNWVSYDSQLNKDYATAQSESTIYWCFP